MKPEPITLFFKAHIDTYTRKDGSVVQAHDDKRQAAKKDWRDEENWHSRTMGRMKTLSEDELRYIIKDATEAAEVGEKSGFDSKKTGQYRDEAHYAAMELKKRQDKAKPATDESHEKAKRMAMERAEASTRRKFPGSTSTAEARAHYQKMYAGHYENLTGKKFGG